MRNTIRHFQPELMVKSSEGSFEALLITVSPQNEALSSYSAAQSRCVTPAASLAPARDSWAKKKNLASQSEVDYKKLALVNDDLLKVNIHQSSNPASCILSSNGCR